MGPEAIGPLLGVLQGSDPKLTVQAIQVLTALEVRGAAIYLLAPLLREKSDPELRTVAGAALLRLVGKTPSPAMAVRLLTERATAYFDRSQPVRTDADGRVELWHWDAAAKAVYADAVRRRRRRADPGRPACPRCLRPGARGSGRPAALPGHGARGRGVSDRSGQADAGDRGHGGGRSGKRFGATVLEGVLDYAMAGDHIGGGHGRGTIARANRQGVGTAVSRREAGACWCRAARHPDRRVRMAACEAIVRLKPAEIVRRRELCAGDAGLFRRPVRAAPAACCWAVRISKPWAEMVGALTSLGFEFDTATSGRELIRGRTTSPDYELALIQTSIDQPDVDFLVQQLRHDYRSATLRVGLLARTDDFERTERIARRDPMTMAFYPPQRRSGVRWQVDQLATLAPRTFVDLPSGSGKPPRRWTCWPRSATTARASSTTCAASQDAVLAALYNPALAVKAMAVLANVNSAESQQALVDVASRFTLPIEIAPGGGQAFRLNTQRHGILLTDRGNHAAIRAIQRAARSMDAGNATRAGADARLHRGTSKVVQAIETRGPKWKTATSKKQ